MKANRIADVTLLLEGTYPYVRGGVSGWVHQIIQGLPQFTFSLVFLGTKPSDYDGQKYPHLDNVVHLECHYLYDEASIILKPKSCQGNSQYFLDTETLHKWFRDPGANYDENITKQVLTTLGKKSGCTAEEFFYSEAAWEQICASHQRFCP